MGVILIIIITFAISGTIYLFFQFRNLPFIDRAPKFTRGILAGILCAALFHMAFIMMTFCVALFFYLVLAYAVMDIALYFAGKFPAGQGIVAYSRRVYLKHLFAFVFAGMVCLYGYTNAKDLRVTGYRINVARPLPGGKLRIVFVSDIHLGNSIREAELDKMLAIVNRLNADVIFLGGDIYDEKTTKAERHYSYGIWKQLKSKYGIFYVTGNHEYYMFRSSNSSPSTLFEELAKSGVRPMADEVLKVGDAFYLIGRLDRSIKTRAPLRSLAAEADKKYPLIVLDHQPHDLNRGKAAGVDLQLSGHTHAGQLFPGNLLVMLANGFSYGHFRNGTYNLIVSSGMGSWRMPIRTSKHAEIVLIDLSNSDELSSAASGIKGVPEFIPQEIQR